MIFPRLAKAEIQSCGLKDLLRTLEKNCVRFNAPPAEKCRGGLLTANISEYNYQQQLVCQF
jgi:hypothetical protein